MGKCILLVRASTINQEVETQKKELINLALNDGYRDKDILIIEGVGSSAIKLNSIYEQQMTELYNTIEEGNISSVYAWEISRIGRKEEILMQFKNFLIARHVQLIIKNPSLRLLNTDGSVNTGVELSFSLFATMAKQEMILKVERFKRAKQRNKLEGKFNGGYISIGYRLDSHKHLVVDEDNAKIVRDIFNFYVKGKTSKEIFNYLEEIEFFKKNNRRPKTTKAIRAILKDRSYVGEKNHPQIISKEVYYKANSIIRLRTKQHKSKNVYFGKGLLVDVKTQHKFTSNLCNLDYTLKTSERTLNLNINVIDFICFLSANELYYIYQERKSSTDKIEAEQSIENNKILINQKQKLIETLKKKMNNAFSMHLDYPQQYDKEQLDSFIQKKEKEVKTLKEEITNLEIDNSKISSNLEGRRNNFFPISEAYSDERKKEIINQMIKCIEVTQIKEHNYILHVKDNLDLRHSMLYTYTSKGRSINVVQILNNGKKREMTEEAKNYIRFRKLKNKKTSTTNAVEGNKIAK